MFGCLHVELSEGLLCQLQRREMEVVRLLQKTLFCLFIVAVDGDFFQDESWRGKGKHQSQSGEILHVAEAQGFLETHL